MWSRIAVLVTSCILTSGAFAAELDVSTLTEIFNCDTYDLSKDHRQIILQGEVSVWAIFCTGPANVILQIKDDPALSFNYPPHQGGSELPVFVGNMGYDYTLNLSNEGGGAKVYVCATPKALNSDAALGAFEDGVDAYEAGEYLIALRILVPLAEEGLARAQYVIGEMYRLGRGLEQDIKAAITWH